MILKCKGFTHWIAMILQIADLVTISQEPPNPKIKTPKGPNATIQFQFPFSDNKI